MGPCGNLGLFRNGSRPEPSRKYEAKRLEREDNSKTFVKVNLQDLTHWVFKGLKVPNFVARCDRFWDMNMTARARVPDRLGASLSAPAGSKLGEFTVLAASPRGPELMVANKGQMVLVMFPFKQLFRDTVMLMDNFIKRQTAAMKVCEDSKQIWYEWMMMSGGARLLDVTKDPYVKYELSSRPLYANDRSCWIGRNAESDLNLLPSRSLSCPPAPNLCTISQEEPQSLGASRPFATESSQHRRPVGYDMNFAYKAATGITERGSGAKQACRGVRRQAVRATCDNRGLPVQYGSTYNKFLGRTQSFSGMEDPYKAQMVSKPGGCFRSRQPNEWLDHDFRYALGLGATMQPGDIREGMSTPIGGRQPMYSVHRDYNPLARPVQGEIRWVAANYGRRVCPERWQGRHISHHASSGNRSTFPEMKACDFHRTSAFASAESKNYELSKMLHKSHNKTIHIPQC